MGLQMKAATFKLTKSGRGYRVVVHRVIGDLKYVAPRELVEELVSGKRALGCFRIGFRRQPRKHLAE